MENSEILHFQFSILNLLVLSVQLVFAATAAELIELKPVRRVLFVLRRHVIALFALSALQNDIVPRHFFTL